MDVLKHKMAATSLVETIVASVIFMIVFVVAIDLLSSVLIGTHTDGREAAIYDVRHVGRSIQTGDAISADSVYSFPWGEVCVRASFSPTSAAVQELIVTGILDDGHTVTLRYLVPTNPNRP